MTRHLMIALFAALLLASCSQSAKDRAAKIEKIETELKESSAKSIADTAKVRLLLKEYCGYIKAFPTDTQTVVYMMKSAKFYDFMSAPDSALYYYSAAYAQFPAFPKANVALFSEAYIYANEKHDFPKAETLYKEYISKYPNTSLAKTVKLELDNLGLTPDQIMAKIDSIKSIKDSLSTAKK